MTAATTQPDISPDCRDWRCRDCRRPWDHHIRPAPMVHDAVWATLGCEPDTLLCDGCFRAHTRHTLARAPQLADLRVCPFNIEHWHHIELTRPGQQRQDFEAGVCASLRAEADMFDAGDAQVRP